MADPLVVELAKAWPSFTDERRARILNDCETLGGADFRAFWAAAMWRIANEEGS